MKPKTVLLLNAGGLRSLVAAALSAYNEPDTRRWFLFVDDGRPDTDRAFGFVQKQAQKFGAFRVDRVAAALNPAAVLPPSQNSDDLTNAASLRRPSVLLTALAFAHQRGIPRVQVPLACNQDFDQAALLTQQLDLCQALIDLEPTPHHRSADTTTPALETPLLDFTDAQILELGAQTNADFAQAWTCTAPGTPTPGSPGAPGAPGAPGSQASENGDSAVNQQHCWRCPACKRRADAFKQSGLLDPLAPLNARRGQAVARV